MRVLLTTVFVLLLSSQVCGQDDWQWVDTALGWMEASGKWLGLGVPVLAIQLLRSALKQKREPSRAAPHVKHLYGSLGRATRRIERLEAQVDWYEKRLAERGLDTLCVRQPNVARSSGDVARRE